MDNFELYDGSGLSRADRIPAAALAQTLELLAKPRYAHTLGSILEGMPVAGEAGSTLGPEYGRFTDPNSQCTVGKVGARTGAIALSGLTQGKDGKWKVFSFTENGLHGRPADTKHAMDGLAATVTTAAGRKPLRCSCFQGVLPTYADHDGGWPTSPR